MPEEINRVVADHLSDILFCPTNAAVANLTREGIVHGVHNCGDLMYDAALLATKLAEKQPNLIERLGLLPKGYTVATLHRAENVDDPNRLSQILAYLKIQAGERPVVLPMHPRTRRAVAAANLDLAGLTVIEPVSYLGMSQLLHDATLVITDSGGVQKEAYFHRVPCVTMREETEWVETIENGWNRLWSKPDYEPRRVIDEYGDGRASEKMVETILSQLGRR
jgi:UDP-GlcNAc3NAcA epimerase